MPAVIFDMDGVLVDSEPLHFAVERQVFEELGIDLSPEAHHNLVGMTPLHIWTQLRERFGLREPAPVLVAREAERKVPHFEAREVPLVDGVTELLERLRARSTPLALASSSPRRIIELFLRKTDTARYFRYVVSGEEVPRGKPAPDIFLDAARALGVAAPACIVIEDSANGLRAALSAGMRAVGFQNPHSGSQDLRAAHLLLDSFSEENVEQVLALLDAAGAPDP